MRKVSKEELAKILADHKLWLEAKGKEGKQANLINADLQGANLGGANLQEAGLFAVNLQGANLRGAHLQKAHLRGTILRDADLSNADLTGTTDLLGGNLGGSTLVNAKLPGDIAKFEGLTHVEETSRNARKIFLAMLLGCAYSWLTIATTTDARLLTNSASSPLPIIQTEIPIAGFYWAAPIILLSLYFYFHLYLQRLWRGLAALPAVFPDGKALDERAYPWLLNGLVRAHFKRLQGDRPPLSRLENFIPWLLNGLARKHFRRLRRNRRPQDDRLPLSRLENWISILLAWWVVPFTLLLFWGRYLPRHEWIGTALHIALLVVLVGAAIMLYRIAARTLRGDEGRPIRWRRPWSDERSRQVAVVLGIGILLTVFSYGSINGTRTENPVFADVRTWVPRAFALVGYSTFADLREADVSTRPENWWTAEDELEIIKGARLKERDLRYADAVGAFLVRADLRDADLQEAFLVDANLRAADLRDAKLQKADLQGANLQEAVLTDAKLQGAILGDANLQGADLRDAKLQGADLLGADLQGADLSRANLQEANLRHAKLQGADLSRAHLQEADLSYAKLQEADFLGAILRGADLWQADLQGANLQGANLQGADLRLANLQEANLFDANLRGAKFQDANLQGADLSYAILTDTTGLTKEQLDQACGNEYTKLPPVPPGLTVKPCPQ